jgi:glucose/arabinose dehydrogenase/endonuclease YncB( thermonuclease family)
MFRVRGISLFVAGTFLAGVLSGQGQGQEKHEPRPKKGPVDYRGFVRVIDGDTVEIYLNGSQVGVGLIGVSAPSAVTPCGKQASAMLKQLSKGGLWLSEDDNLTYDARTRRMYYAQARDLRSVAKELVKSGVALTDGNGKEAKDLKNLEDQAKKSHTGCINDAGANVPAAVAAGEEAAVTESEPDVAGRTEAAAATAAATQVTPAAAQPSLPSGFIQQTVVSGLTNPTTFTLLPDGRMLIPEQKGFIRVFKNGALLPTPFLDLTSRVNDYWDHGLLGIAADPQFATNGFVYVLYTYENDRNQYTGSKTARLSRFTANGDTAALSTEQVIVGQVVGATCNSFATGTDCIPSDQPSHSVGNIRFAGDGSMFVTIGDASSFNIVDDNALRVQNLDLLNGKMLRITTTGAGLSSNPFWNNNASANRSKVWAYGLRNSYRFSIQPGSNIPFLGDVGWDTWEEVDVVTKGANLGWPCYEGTPQQPGYAPKPVCQTLYSQGTSVVTAPLYSYQHNGVSSAATGGFFYTGTAFPAAYQGAYFFGDYARSVIRYLKVDSSNRLASGPNDFLFAADGPVHMELGPDQALYYVAINTGEVRKVVYAGTTAPPPTVTSVNPADGASGIVVSTSVKATFSQGLQSSTVNTSTFQLVKQGTSTPIAATVTYSGANSTATLTPTASLSPTTTYIATLKGGASGIQDLALTPMASDVSWTFQTAALPTPPAGTTYVSDLNWTSMSNGWGPVEKDRSNGEQALGDGKTLSIRGVTFPKGLGAHAASDVRYYVGGLCSAFNATVGLDDETINRGSVVFQVWGDGTKLFDSGLMNGTMAGKAVSANLSGKSELRLVITDGGDGFNYDHGDWGGARVTCGSGAAPTATITSPASTLTYKVGDVVSYSGSAVDFQGQAIPATGLGWQIIIHHCPGGLCHTHSLVSSTGPTGSFTVPDHGDDSYFEIILTATDSSNRSSSKSVSIQPKTVLLTLATSPSGLQLVYGGDTVTAPFTHATIIGSKHTILAPSPQGSASFVSWSDNGAAQHDILVGSTNLTITATFTGGTPPPQTITRYVSDLTWTSMSNGWGPVEKDKSNGEQASGDGRTITIRGTPYPKGLGAHAASDVRYNLPGACSTFSAVVGIDDEVAPKGSVVFQVWGDSTKLYDSGVLTGSSAPVTVSANLAGRSQLRLVVTDGGNGFDYDHADWANAQITCSANRPPSGTSYVSDLTWTSMTNGWGPLEKDKSNGEQAAGDGRQISIRGAKFTKGLGGHAASDVRYSLAGACSTFTATVGIDDEVAPNGSVVFQVWGDGTKLYDSGVRTGTSAAATAQANVSGKSELRLVITDGGNGINYDHADWANAQITCQ